MSDPTIGDTGEGFDVDANPTDDGLTGLEGYPYASVEAEKRIKLITTVISFVAVGVLLVGLYLALFTQQIGVGGLLALIGFFDLMFVPFVAKRMRRAALAREAPQQ